MPGQISHFLTNTTETLLTHFVSKRLKKSAASADNTNGQMDDVGNSDLSDGDETHKQATITSQDA